LSLLRRDVLLALAIGVGVFLIQLPVCRHGVSLLDEGVILQIAEDVRSGLRPYRDAVYPAFPGVLYLTAAAFALGGTSVETARVLSAALFAIATGAVYLIARWRLSRSGAATTVVLFMLYRAWAYPAWQFLNYSTLAVTLVLLATCIVGEALAQSRSWPFALAGACGGAAFLSKQDCGLVGSAALGVALLLRRTPGGRGATAFVAGGGVVVAAALAALAVMGSWRDFVEQTVVTPLYIWRHFDYPRRPALRPFLEQDAAIRGNPFAYLPPLLFELDWPALSQSAVFRRTALVDATVKCLYHLPWVVVLAAGLMLWGRLRRPASTLTLDRDLMLILVGVSFVLAFNRPQDWIHLMVLYPPALLLGAVLIDGAARRWRAVGLAALVLLGGSTGLSAVLVFRFVQDHSTPVRSARGTLYATAPQAEALQGLLDALARRSPTQAPLAALPYHPLVNFLAARPGLSRYYWLWPVYPNPDREGEIARDILSQPDSVVVYSPTQTPHFPRLGEYAPALFRELVDHFALDQAFGGGPGAFTFLLLRRREFPPGSSLLGGPLATARVRVEPRDGPAGDFPLPDRPDLAAAALWPFLPVLRVTTLPDAAVSVSYRFQPAQGQQLRASYGVNPDHWPDFPPARARFAIAVRGAGGEETDLLAADVDPFHRPEDRRWRDAAIDLGPWSGQTIDLVLRVTGPPGAQVRRDVAGFGDLRLLSPSKP